MSENIRVRMNATSWEQDLGLERVEGPLPELRRDQVRVEVEACGVCYRDCIDRDGRFKFIRIPITPGHEAVGRVVAVGPAADEFAVGQRVATMHRDYCGQCPACKAGETSVCAFGAAVPGLTIDGGYARFLTVPQRVLFEVPDQIAASDAAVMHCTFGTAFRGLRRVGLQPGERVLVTGANGGVGNAAIQVARRLGASVTAIVRAEGHEEKLASLGADSVVLDDGSGFHKKLRGQVIDVALDCVGPPTFRPSLRSLRAGGRLVVIGNVNSDRPQVNLGYLITKGLEIFGSSGATRSDMKALFELHLQQPFEVCIEKSVGLELADQAQRDVRAGGRRGRIVLIPGATEPSP